MLFSIILLLIGFVGFALASKSILQILFCLELMLLAGTLVFLFASSRFADAPGSLFSLFAICIAGAESAIGLGLVVSLYRLRGSLSLL